MNNNQKQPTANEPVINRTNSNTSKVSLYPAQCVPADLARFLFSTAKKIHLYECDAHPNGMGVVK